MIRDNANSDLLGRYSSFHSVEQTIGVVIDLLLKSERLKRLLYYPDKRALHLPKLRTDQTMEILKNEQIRIIPKLDVTTSAKSYVIISLDNFQSDGTTPYFRSFRLQFDIICPYSQWQLADFKLRPYSIAGEIDTLVNTSNINKAGIANFVGSRSLLLNNDVGGISLYYDVSAVGTDMKLNPAEKPDGDSFN